MKKVPKGSYGYIPYEKKRRILITAGMFAIPLLIFLTGFLMTHTRKNMFTLIAILGCLPASKAAVSMIIICMQKQIDKMLYEKIRTHVKDLTCIYDGVVSSYEKNMPFACIVISGLNVVCYSLDEKLDANFAQTHIQKILQGNGYRANVKVFQDEKHFLQRVDEVYAHREEWEAQAPFRPDPRYPDATRNELVRSVILAICI